MKTIAILVEDTYQDQEVWYPYFRFREEGHKPVAVGTGRASVYKSKYGVDGNLITSRKPEDLPAFMKAVIKAIK